MSARINLPRFSSIKAMLARTGEWVTVCLLDENEEEVAKQWVQEHGQKIGTGVTLPLPTGRGFIAMDSFCLIRAD